MRAKLDIDNLHIEADTPDGVVMIFQKCKLKDLVDDGKKRKTSLTEKSEHYVTIALVLSIIIFILVVLVKLIPWSLLKPFGDILFVLYLIAAIAIGVCLYLLHRNYTVFILVFVALMIVLLFVEGFSDKKSTITNLIRVAKSPLGLYDNGLDSLMRDSVKINSGD